MKGLIIINYLLWSMYNYGPEIHEKGKQSKVYSSKNVISSKSAIPIELHANPLDSLMEFPKIVPYNAIPINPKPITDVNPPS
jgi:hypothetical protein